jgi:tetratricopeptide (TPR) repeat protein
MSQLTSSSPGISKDNDILLLAQMKYKDRDYLGALVEYTKLIQLNLHDALTLCDRGGVYYRLGDLKSAMSDYTKAIEIDPNLEAAYYRRGFLHYLAKNYSSAIMDYNRSIELKPDFALAYANRGYAYRDLHGEQEALIDWRFAAKLFKDQGNLKKHESTMKLINNISGEDSFVSGVLW